MAEKDATIILDKEEGSTPEPAPKEEKYIRINPGDSLQSIAEAHGTTIEIIAKRNAINPEYYAPGQWIWV